MFDPLRLWAGVLVRLFHSRQILLIENLALRQQLAVFKRQCRLCLKIKRRSSLVDSSLPARQRKRNDARKSAPSGPRKCNGRFALAKTASVRLEIYGFPTAMPVT
jgi:hypothetical protein